MSREDDDRDRAAARAVQEGDTDAFALLVDAYRLPLHRQATRYLGSAEAADDALQDLFLKAFRLIGAYDADRPFAPWLYRLAANHLRTAYGRRRRRKDREAPGEMDLEVSALAEPPDALERRTDLEEIRAAVNELPEKLQDVVRLYYLEEMSVEEVCEDLGLGRENVKSRLHRARKLLRRYLVGFWEEQMQPPAESGGSNP